jgi:multiple antibiotic resistance protein
MFAAVAPFGALSPFLACSRSPQHPSLCRLAALAAAVAFTILALSGLASAPILELLAISPPSFQFAAAVLMAPLAVRLLVAGNGMPPDIAPAGAMAWLVPLGTPLLAGPTSVVAAVSYGGRFGEGIAVAAAALAITVSGALLASGPSLESRIGRVGIAILGRLSGLLLIGVAIEFAIDGTHSV